MDKSIEVTMHYSITTTNEKIFQAMLDTFLSKRSNEPCNTKAIINWVLTNLSFYIGEFIYKFDHELDAKLIGEIEEENITELLNDEEFMCAFEKWLNE